MPDSASHLDLAKKNQEVLKHLQQPDGRFASWVAVVAFYRALHLIEAALYLDCPNKHGGSHYDRFDILKRNNRYKNIYAHYRVLYACSMVARYMEHDQVNRTYSSFQDYMSAEDVDSKIVNHHLKQVENSVAKILKSHSVDTNFG
jgi:hypothetical protein